MIKTLADKRFKLSQEIFGFNAYLDSLSYMRGGSSSVKDPNLQHKYAELQRRVDAGEVKVTEPELNEYYIENKEALNLFILYS